MKRLALSVGPKLNFFLFLTQIKFTIKTTFLSYHKLIHVFECQYHNSANFFSLSIKVRTGRFKETVPSKDQNITATS